jgi:hypothetical protein
MSQSKHVACVLARAEFTGLVLPTPQHPRVFQVEVIIPLDNPADHLVTAWAFNIDSHGQDRAHSIHFNDYFGALRTFEWFVDTFDLTEVVNHLNQGPVHFVDTLLAIAARHKDESHERVH